MSAQAATARRRPPAIALVAADAEPATALARAAAALRPSTGVRRSAWPALGAVTLAVATLVGPVEAQQVRAVVEPDTVTVGQVARAAVRIDLPPGWWVVLPDSLPPAEDLESAGPRILRTDTLEDRSRTVTVVYPLAVWRPGTAELPVLRLHAGGPNGEREVDVAFPPLEVRSVLPTEAGSTDPRPLKDVLGPNRTLWPLLLLAGLVSLLAGAWLWRRARRRPPAAPPPAQPVPPREAALAALDRARASGLLETGRLKAFYSIVSEALREYLDAIEPRWGAELTTSELRQRMSADVRPEEIAALVRILFAADMVKFARRRASVAEAETDWRAARAWVERFEPQSEAAAPEAAMAGAGAGEELP